MIRRATDNDLCEIFRIWNDAHQHNYGWPRAEKIPGDLVEITQQKQNYVHLHNSRIVGWIAWDIDGQNCILDGIYVAPDLQRHGIGSKLLDFMISQIVAKPVSSVSAAVLKKGSFAIEFYMKCGFEVLNIGDVYLDRCNVDLVKYLEGRKDSDHAYVAIKKLLPE